MARIEDLKEVAPCGMRINYTVDNDTDFITYTDINGRGEGHLQKDCERCTWRGICKPTAISKEALVKELAEIQAGERRQLRGIYRLSGRGRRIRGNVGGSSRQQTPLA